MTDRYPIEALCLRSAKGHEYQAEPLPKRRASWGTRIDDTCTRCKSERVRIIDANGDISSRWYDESPAYRAVLDENYSTQEARLALVWWLRKGIA